MVDRETIERENKRSPTLCLFTRRQLAPRPDSVGLDPLPAESLHYFFARP
jgi:hypothetical protein